MRAAFERQAADDWKLFLSLRAAKLSSGGRLVVVLSLPNEDGVTQFEHLFNGANEALVEMVSENLISADEKPRMVLGSYGRRTSELVAPFGTNGQFCGLAVEHCELFGLPDAAWKDYERDGDKEALFNRHVGFFRSIFVPYLASALQNSGSKLGFADILAQKAEASSFGPTHALQLVRPNHGARQETLHATQSQATGKEKQMNSTSFPNHAIPSPRARGPHAGHRRSSFYGWWVSAVQLRPWPPHLSVT